MHSSAINAQALARSGIEALQRGELQAARALFESITSAGLADASIHLALAITCRGMKDKVAALAAIDAALSLEPRNLHALIFKGDHFTGAGDPRAAIAYYQAALKVAPDLSQLPAELRVELQRVAAVCNRFAGEFENILADHLARAAGWDGDRSSRFARSLDMLFGRKEIFVQQPQYFYFPELPQIQFYDRKDFPWLDAIEAATPAIRAELTEILRNPSAFQPYVQSEANRPQVSRGMVNNADWSAFYLWKNGEPVSENISRCPQTMAALAAAPITRMPKRSPSILFSLLRPGARIPPHTGFINTRLICHLPLIVPPQCGFRVGSDTREWIEGKAWLFDDTIEHEAWNLSDQTRVILLFEIWRPELSLQERELVTAMFEAIDLSGRGSPAWSM